MPGFKIPGTGKIFSMREDTDEQQRQRFGLALSAARREVGLTQSELATRLDVAQTSISNWENGLWDVAVETVFAIERAVELAPGTLSRIFGFLPVIHVDYTVEEAIDKTDALTEMSKVALRAMYQELVRLKVDRPKPPPRRLRR